jgi:hypothetical protein
MPLQNHHIVMQMMGQRFPDFMESFQPTVCCTNASLLQWWASLVRVPPSARTDLPAS